MLTLLGSTGLLGLAGCSGDGEGTSTPTEDENEVLQTQTETESQTPVDELAHVEDQTLTFTSGVIPEQSTFLAYGGTNVVDTERRLATGVLAAMTEPLFWGIFQSHSLKHPTGKANLLAAENINVEPEKVSVTLRDDVYWSDGEQVTAKDIAVGMVNVRLANGVRHPDESAKLDTPATAWEMITDFSFPDGKDGLTFVLHASNGQLKKASRYMSLAQSLRWRGGVHAPTHTEPYKEWANALFDLWDQAKKGEVNPWDPERNDPYRNTLRKNILGTKEHVEMMSKPENIVTNGVFQLDEIRGTQEYVLTKNQHHRLADEVNFDEVRFVYNESDDREIAALNAGDLDHSRQSLDPGVIDNLPESYEVELRPAPFGGSIGIQHANPHLGKVKVRQAIAHLLNTENIARNIHPNKTTPVTVPGGDIWMRDTLVSDDWVENNLIEYAHDNRERARELLQEAGYSQEDGTWTGDDGSLEFEISTASEAPKFETTIAQQLDDFGISAQVQTYDDATYADVLQEGENHLFPSTRGTGFLWTALDDWFEMPHYVPYYAQQSVYGEDAVQKVEERGGYAENGFSKPKSEGIAWAEENAFTVEAPPVGEPDGELQTYSPYRMSKPSVLTVGSESELQERAKKILWLWNYYLPEIPIYRDQNMSHVDKAHWQWPDERGKEFLWDHTDLVMSASELPSWGKVMADPENPEEGANVQE